jgi:hypothetical protein
MGFTIELHRCLYCVCRIKLSVRWIAEKKKLEGRGGEGRGGEGGKGRGGNQREFCVL